MQPAVGCLDRDGKIAHTRSSVSASVTVVVASSASGGVSVCVLSMSSLVLLGSWQVGLQLGGCTPLRTPRAGVMGAAVSTTAMAGGTMTSARACVS